MTGALEALWRPGNVGEDAVEDAPSPLGWMGQAA